MLKKILGGILVGLMLQGTAFAAEQWTSKSPAIPNNFWKVYRDLKPKKTYSPYDYDSAETFANFREVATTGMKRNTFYRTSNPLDTHGNMVRDVYADRLARKNGIKVEIDLADRDAKLKKFLNKSSVKKKYCYSIYENGKLFNTKLSGGAGNAADWPKIAAAYRFMLANDGPYLVHCTFGKDRAGFFSMLTAALAGATLEDLRKDYVQTYVNYYHVVPGSYEYKVIEKFAADRILYYIGHPEYAGDRQPMPSNINVHTVVPEKAARSFFKVALGFTDEEIDMLRAKLCESN